MKRACRRCESDQDHTLARNNTLSGAVQVGLICSSCNGWTVDRRGRLWIPLAEVRQAGYDPDELPIAITISPSVRCARCGARGVEEHHWAPRAIFGPDAERWPKDYLCGSCHTEWNRAVTPSLVGDA